MDMSYSTLAGSDITSSFNQVNNLLNKKEIEISVNYEDYNDFVYFSSAHTRLQNFYYKAGLIQSASAQLGSITSSTTGSSAYSSSQASLNSIIETTIKNLDTENDTYESYIPLLLNSPSISSKADIINNKYTISSVSQLPKPHVI